MAQLSSPHKPMLAGSTKIDTHKIDSSPGIKVEPSLEARVDSLLPDYEATYTPTRGSTISKASTPPPAPCTPVLPSSFSANCTSTSSPHRYTCTNSPIPAHPQMSSLAPSSTVTTRRAGRQGRVAKERTLVRNKPIETVNYPCYEELSEFHRQKLLELNVYPVDGISNYSRSIPFKGAKESFLKSTGRSRFDVFEYRFTAPNIKGEDKNWWVMWDYYNGLVRVHDFFDCCKPGKTEPGNAVKEKINPGLQSICHNITGGNLHAQGYWIPYPAAKALASKFCFRIRYALTIIFGEDFPSLCLPESHPNFGKYSIDPTIIEACKETSAKQFVIEKERASTSPRQLNSATPSVSRPKVLSPATNIPSSEGCESISAIQTQKPGQTGRYQASARNMPTSDSNDDCLDVRIYKSGQTGRYYDTARGTWTIAGGNRISTSSENNLRPADSTTPTKTSIGVVFKPERAPKANYSGAFGGINTVKRAPAVPSISHMYMQMSDSPATGHYYFNESCVRGSRPFITTTSSQRTQEGSGVPGSEYSKADDRHTTYSPSNPAIKSFPTTSRPSPQSSVRETAGRGIIIKRCNPKNAFTPPPKAEAPLLPAIGLDLEDSQQPPDKKQRLMEPRRFNNPYMNRVTLEVGTFQNTGPRSSRDKSLPRIQNPFTRECYDRLMFSQIEEKPEEVQAASSLMALKCRYHDKDLVESSSRVYHMSGGSCLKRRRST